MSKWAKKVKKGSSNSDVDYDYINSQVATGRADVTISGILDLGKQEGGWYFNEKGVTYFETEEEVHDFLTFIAEQEDLGERLIDKHDLDDWEEGLSVFELPFRVVNDTYVFLASEKEDNITYAPTEKKAKKLLKQALTIAASRAQTVKGTAKKYADATLKELQEFVLEEQEDMYRVDCSVTKMQAQEEMTVFVENTNNLVEYAEGDEASQKHFRLELTPPFKGNVKGLSLRTDPKTGVFSGKALVDLLEACGLEDVLDPKSEDMGDLSLLIDSSFHTQVVGEKFFKCKGRLPVDEDAEIPVRTSPSLCITFEDEPEEIAAQIKAFYLKKAYTDKIKAAINYEGSNMEKAFAILEGSQEPSEDSSDEVEEEEVAQDTPETEVAEETSEEPKEAPKKKKKTPAKKKAAAKKAPKKEEPEVVEEDDDFDDDLPF